MGQGPDLFYPDLGNATCETPYFCAFIGTLEDKWKLSVRPSGMLPRFMQRENKQLQGVMRSFGVIFSKFGPAYETLESF